MNQAITDFIQSKSISLNSQMAYGYDLQQFLDSVKGDINPQSLLLYQQSLLELTVAAQRRKLSAVNQFLYFLYEKKQLNHYYKLQPLAEVTSFKKPLQQEDLSLLFAESPWKDGQLIALLASQLGLTPREMAGLTTAEVQLDFQVLTVVRCQSKRVLSLPKAILPYLEGHLSGVYLFDKKGRTYSRQWFFNRLTEYIQSIGKPDWTAHKLREQYILGQLEQGRTLDQIAKQLGLKSSASLEQYR